MNVKQLIFGQGATGNTRPEARPFVHGGEENERMLAAFGMENHQSELNWEEAYGEGVQCVAHYYQHSRVGVIELLWLVARARYCKSSCDHFCYP